MDAEATRARARVAGASGASGSQVPRVPQASRVPRVPQVPQVPQALACLECLRLPRVPRAARSRVHCVRGCDHPHTPRSQFLWMTIPVPRRALGFQALSRPNHLWIEGCSSATPWDGGITKKSVRGNAPRSCARWSETCVSVRVSIATRSSEVSCWTPGVQGRGISQKDLRDGNTRTSPNSSESRRHPK